MSKMYACMLSIVKGKRRPWAQRSRSNLATEMETTIFGVHRCLFAKVIPSPARGEAIDRNTPVNTKISCLHFFRQIWPESLTFVIPSTQDANYPRARSTRHYTECSLQRDTREHHNLLSPFLSQNVTGKFDIRDNEYTRRKLRDTPKQFTVITDPHPWTAKSVVSISVAKFDRKVWHSWYWEQKA